jgi:fatty acid desaturase
MIVGPSFCFSSRYFFDNQGSMPMGRVQINFRLFLDQPLSFIYLRIMQKVLQLRYIQDLRSLAFVAAYFGFLSLAWLSISAPWYVWLAWTVLLCFWSFFCATIVHNTIHSPVFRKKSWNKAFQLVLTLTYGHPVSAYVPGHNFSHHRFTQTPLDSIRTHKARFRWNFLNQLFFFYLMVPSILKAERKFVRRMRVERPRWFRQYILESVVLNGFRLILLLIDWRAFLCFLVVPHQYAAWGIVGTNYWQHEGCDENHPYNHSRNFVGNWLNFFAFNNGYHGMHHERPGMHWSLLPQAHRRWIAPHLHPNLEQKNLLKYLWQAYVHPGKRVDYLGRPVVLKPVEPDQDWVDQIPVSRHEADLGAVRA